MRSKLFLPGLLDGQVAIVSGGGSGLGRPSALELASLAARAVVCGRREGLPGMAHSSAALAAVESLTRVLSIEWARFGIRPTALAAGHFATDTL